MGLFSDSFYLQLAESGKILDTDPRDLLVLFASETNLNPAATAGLPYHGFNTMSRDFAIANGVPGDVWDKLPTMSPEDNLHWSTIFFRNYLNSFKRSGFTSALDAYLANFSPAAWVKDVGFNSVIFRYTDDNSYNYLENATIDNPALYQYAKSKGLPFSNSKDIANAARTIIHERGVPNDILKGTITVGDLQTFMLRPGLESIWGPHVKRYEELGLVAYAKSGSLWKAAVTDYNSLAAYNPSIDEQEFKRRRQAASGGSLQPADPTRQMQSFQRTYPESKWGFFEWALLGGGVALGIYAIKKVL